MEIEDVPEAEFDFVQLQSELHDAFFWYGIYAITREVSNLFEAAGFTFPEDRYGGREGAGELVLTVETLDRIDGTREDVVRYSYQASDRVDEIWQVAQGAREVFDVVDVSAQERVDATMALNRMELYSTPLSAPFSYIETVRDMFDAPIPEGEPFGVVWDGQFAGPPWVGICDYLLEFQEMPKTAWIDQGWAVEHNNAGWIDKVGFDRESYAIAEEILQFLQPETFDEGGIQTHPAGHPEDRVLRSLKYLLDANQAGEMEPVFETAALFDDEIDVNIDRYRRLFM